VEARPFTNTEGARYPAGPHGEGVESGFLIEHDGCEIQLYLQPVLTGPDGVMTFALRQGIGHASDRTLHTVQVTPVGVTEGEAPE